MWLLRQGCFLMLPREVDDGDIGDMGGKDDGVVGGKDDGGIGDVGGKDDVPGDKLLHIPPTVRHQKVRKKSTEYEKGSNEAGNREK